MTSVAGSAASRSSAASIITPPTRSSRSRPPTPIAWETPAPNRSIRQLTCWRPVPDAPTSPIEPAPHGVGEPERHAVEDRGAAVRAHDEQALARGERLELDLVLDRDVVAEQEDVEAPLERLERLGRRIGPRASR